MAKGKKIKMTDTNLLLMITVVVFVVMYLGAMLFLKKGFLKRERDRLSLETVCGALTLPKGRALIATILRGRGKHDSWAW